ncbi:MAG: glycoside hydrolase family 37, partial [Bacteroidetes bacterium]|nr:glycoside hydrolase family 37 [Bacteroidota bacterium]
MKNRIYILIAFLLFSSKGFSQDKDSVKHYITVIKSNIYKDYKKMYRKASGSLIYPFLTPGSNQYDNV